MPDQAKEDTPEGAAAFVAYWIDVFNYAAETGDVDELSALSSSECEGCQEYVVAIRSMYEAGGYRVGGSWTAEDFQVAEIGDRYLVTLDVSWDRSRFRTRTDSSEEIGEADADTLTFEVDGRQVTQLVIGTV